MHVPRPGILCRAAGKAGVSEHAVLPLKGSHDCSAACIKRHRARSNGGPDSFTLKQTTPLLSRHISAAAGAAAVRGQSRNSAQQRLIESHQTTHSRVRFSFQSLPFLSQGSLTSGSTRHAIRQLNSRGISHPAPRIAHHPPLSPPSFLCCSCRCSSSADKQQPPPPTPPPPTTTLEITVRLLNRHSEVTRAPDGANPAIAFPRWCSSTPAPSETYSSPEAKGPHHDTSTRTLPPTRLFVTPAYTDHCLPGPLEHQHLPVVALRASPNQPPPPRCHHLHTGSNTGPSLGHYPVRLTLASACIRATAAPRLPHPHRAVYI